VNANTVSTTGRNSRPSEYLRDVNGRFLSPKSSRRNKHTLRITDELSPPSAFITDELLKAEIAKMGQSFRESYKAIFEPRFPTFDYLSPTWDLGVDLAKTTQAGNREAPAAPTALATENPHATKGAPSHTRVAFDPKTMPAIVKWAAGVVEELKADAIAACGHSGLPVAGAVSFLTGVPVLAVRKDGEPVVAGGSFAGRVSGVLPGGVKARRWVWIDDFLSSGGTFRRSSQHLWKEGYIAYPWPEAVLEYRYGQNERVPLSEYKVNITPESFPGFDFSHAPESVPFISWKWKR
jgi:hypothetical protein